MVEFSERQFLGIYPILITGSFAQADESSAVILAALFSLTIYYIVTSVFSVLVEKYEEVFVALSRFELRVFDVFGRDIGIAQFRPEVYDVKRQLQELKESVAAIENKEPKYFRLKSLVWEYYRFQSDLKDFFENDVSEIVSKMDQDVDDIIEVKEGVVGERAKVGKLDALRINGIEDDLDEVLSRMEIDDRRTEFLNRVNDLYSYMFPVFSVVVLIGVVDVQSPASLYVFSASLGLGILGTLKINSGDSS